MGLGCENCSLNRPVIRRRCHSSWVSRTAQIWHAADSGDEGGTSEVEGWTSCFENLRALVYCTQSIDQRQELKLVRR